MEDMKKLRDSELEKVIGGENILEPGELTFDPFPSEDWDIWECPKCQNIRERPGKDRTFWNKNNACECGGCYTLIGHKRR